VGAECLVECAAAVVAGEGEVAVGRHGQLIGKGAGDHDFAVPLQGNGRNGSERANRSKDSEFESMLPLALYRETIPPPATRICCHFAV
jgi:hypothetical protein